MKHYVLAPLVTTRPRVASVQPVWVVLAVGGYRQNDERVLDAQLNALR